MNQYQTNVQLEPCDAEGRRFPPQGGSGTANVFQGWSEPLDVNGRELRTVVSACPRCGAPIYGDACIRLRTVNPSCVYSCECRNKST